MDLFEHLVKEPTGWFGYISNIEGEHGLEFLRMLRFEEQDDLALTSGDAQQKGTWYTRRVGNPSTLSLANDDHIGLVVEAFRERPGWHLLRAAHPGTDRQEQFRNAVGEYGEYFRARHPYCLDAVLTLGESWIKNTPDVRPYAEMAEMSLAQRFEPLIGALYDRPGAALDAPEMRQLVGIILDSAAPDTILYNALRNVAAVPRDLIIDISALRQTVSEEAYDLAHEHRSTIGKAIYKCIQESRARRLLAVESTSSTAS